MGLVELCWSNARGFSLFSSICCFIIIPKGKRYDLSKGKLERKIKSPVKEEVMIQLHFSVHFFFFRRKKWVYLPSFQFLVFLVIILVVVIKMSFVIQVTSRATCEYPFHSYLEKETNVDMFSFW